MVLFGAILNRFLQTRMLPSTLARTPWVSIWTMKVLGAKTAMLPVRTRHRRHDRVDFSFELWVCAELATARPSCRGSRLHDVSHPIHIESARIGFPSRGVGAFVVADDVPDRVTLRDGVHQAAQGGQLGFRVRVLATIQVH